MRYLDYHNPQAIAQGALITDHVCHYCTAPPLESVAALSGVPGQLVTDVPANG